jgi:DNA-binding CsgD family transcriptional regulator
MITYTSLFEQLPGNIGWKDITLKHLGCNQNLATALRLKKSDAIIGLDDSELPDHNPESTLFHKKNDLLAIQGNTIKGLHRAASPYNESYFFFVKKPIYDNLNQIAGLIYHCNVINLPPSLNELLRLNYDSNANHSHYIFGLSENIFNLSHRELECLFLILRGKSAKQTGEIMSLSKRTIESYIENIKNKFGCESKSDLITIAIDHGYMRNIPSRFLNSIK